MTTSYRHIYPERTTPFGGRLPEFPTTCPTCGAEETRRGNRYHPVAYACGGSYDDKPQIQNHTDIWWGSCPVTRAEVAAEAEECDEHPYQSESDCPKCIRAADANRERKGR